MAFLHFKSAIGYHMCAEKSRFEVTAGTRKKRTELDDRRAHQVPRVAESDLPTAAKFVAHPVVGFPGV